MSLLHPTLSIESFEIFLLFISALAGIFGSILGLGGGIIIVPVLTLGLGIHIRYAIGASIISVIATSSGAAAGYLRDRITNIRVGILLESATTLGAFIGAILSPHIPEKLLFIIFSGILFYSGGIMLKKRPDSSVPLEKSDRLAVKLKLNSSYLDSSLGRQVSYHVTHVPLSLVLMLGAGMISAVLGIGSGALKVPAMDRAMRLPIKVSSATSNFMIGVTAATSAGAYLMRGDILPFLAAPVALGVLMGAWFGSRIMVQLPNQKIRLGFILVLFAIGVQMACKGIGIKI